MRRLGVVVAVLVLLAGVLAALVAGAIHRRRERYLTPVKLPGGTDEFLEFPEADVLARVRFEDARARLWSVETASLAFERSGCWDRPWAHVELLRGRLLLGKCDALRAVNVRSLASGAVVASFSTAGDLGLVTASPSGRLVAASSTLREPVTDSTVESGVAVHAARDGALVRTLALPGTLAVRRLFFTRAEDRLVVVADGAWLVYALASGKLVSAVATPVVPAAASEPLAVSPRDEVVFQANKALLGWPIDGGPVRLVAEPANAAAVARSGERVAVWQEGDLAILELATGEVVHRVGIRPLPENGQIGTIVFSPDADRLAVVEAAGGDGDFVLVWELPP